MRWAPLAVGGHDGPRVRARVLGQGHAVRAEHLDPLVEAVHRATRVVDRGQAAIGVHERDDRGIHVVGLRE
jgi:hypothetical protein